MWGSDTLTMVVSSTSMISHGLCFGAQSRLAWSGAAPASPLI